MRDQIDNTKNNYKAVMLGGKHFDTITEAARYCGISLPAMSRRIEREDINDPKILRKPRQVLIDGKPAKIIAWAKKYNLSLNKVEKYIKEHGNSATSKELIANCKPGYDYVYNGKHYTSQKEFARLHNINYHTLRSRIRYARQHKKKNRDMLRKSDHSKQAKPIKIFNLYFKSVYQAGNFFGINMQNIVGYYGRDWHKWPAAKLNKMRKVMENKGLTNNC